MTKLVKQSATYEGSMRHPIAVDPKPPATKIVKDKTAWWFKASSEVGYQGYLVEFTSVSTSRLDFQFINADTGERVAGSKGSCNPSSLDECYPYSPSVIPTDAEFENGKRIGYVFLRDRSLDPPLQRRDAAMAEPAEAAIGKWPQSAEGILSAEHERLLRLTRNIVKLIEQKEIRLTLPPEILRELTHFGL